MDQSRAARILHRLRKADQSTVVSLLVVGYVLGASIAWSAITPPGAVPDEPSHVIYAAGVVRGDLGSFTLVEHPTYAQLTAVMVPRWVGSFTDPPLSTDAFPWPCYASIPSLTANCSPPMSHSADLELIPTTVTRYPPPYYAVVGVPTLALSGETAVYAMRILSSLLVTALIGLGLFVAAPSRRSWLALGSAIAFTPMVGHIAGSINPSAMEFGAAMGLTIGLLGIDRSKRSGQPIIAAGLVALMFAVAWARPLTVTILIAVLASAAVLNPIDLKGWLKVGSTRFIVALGFLGAATSSLAFETFGRDATPLQLDGPGFVSNVAEPTQSLLHEIERRFVEFGFDLIGRFGWLDHSPPVFVQLSWLILVGAVVGLAFFFGSRTSRIALTTVSFGALIAAPIMLFRYLGNYNFYQARYHLSLALIIVLGAARILSTQHDDTKRQMAWPVMRWGAVIVAPVAMFMSLAGSLYRYSVGGQPQTSDLWGLVVGLHEWLPAREMLGVVGLVGFLTGAALLVLWTVTKDLPADVSHLARTES